MFAAALKRVPFTPENGMEVVATGSISHFPKWGKTQIYVTNLEPVGAGALELQYRRLLQEIRAKGWFDDLHKKPIPRFPRRIAVITSATGAALQDVIDTLRRRAPFIELLTLDARMQGDRAAPEIVRAIRRVNARAKELRIDTLILTRGGGSMEDLWAFNHPDVAHAVFHSRVPVIAAIGHETDTTIAELVADLRAATPTQAAMRAAPDAVALADMIDRAEHRLAAAAARTTTRAEHTLRTARAELITAARAHHHRRSELLHKLSSKLTKKHPAAIYATRRTTLSELSDRLVRTLNRAIRAKDPLPLRHRLTAAAAGRAGSSRAHLDKLQRLLETTSPLAALRRGYSITMTDAGELLRDPAAVKPGDHLVTRLETGSIRSTVSGGKRRTKPRDQNDAPPPFDPTRD